jgi:hypothetical protein
MPYHFDSPAAVIRARWMKICTANLQHIAINKMWRHLEEASHFICKKSKRGQKHEKILKIFGLPSHVTKSNFTRIFRSKVGCFIILW